MRTEHLLIPGAIVLAGVLLAAAVYAVRAPDGEGGLVAAAPEAVRPVGDDHILGKPDAPVVVITFSDIDCPFCRDFHRVMKRVLAEYGPSGSVAWVYRHFPVTALHANALRHARATECAAFLGGESAFWAMLDGMIAAAPRNEPLEPSRYAALARAIGVDADALDSCLATDHGDARIARDIDDGINAGAAGTPYSIVRAADGTFIPVTGALPYESMVRIIDEALGTSSF